MPAPFLDGKHVYLRSLTKEDVNGDYLNWLNDEELCKFNTHQRFPTTKESLLEFIESTNKSKTGIILAIICKKTNKHVGNVALKDINYIDSQAEVSNIVATKGQEGLAHTLESFELIIDHAFSKLNLNRIHGGTISAHLVMQKVVEMLHFTKEGVRRQAMYKNNQYYDVIEYGILKEEWVEFKNKRSS